MAAFSIMPIALWQNKKKALSYLYLKYIDQWKIME